jgi:TRAP-type C4-dicarboxylate transport system substrate-binding protein
LALLIRFWYLPVIVLLISALAFAGLYAKNQRLLADAARQELNQALTVNKQNAKALRELQLDRQIERELTRKEIEAAQRRAASIDQLKKDMQNVPGANDPVHPYFDELGDRLRSLDSGTAD